MAGPGDGFQGHVSRPLDRPFGVPLRERMAPISRVMAASLGRGPSATGSSERPNADDVGAALDLAVKALQRIGRVELAATLPREGHVGEQVGLGLVHEGGELGRLVGTGIP